MNSAIFLMVSHFFAERTVSCRWDHWKLTFNSCRLVCLCFIKFIRKQETYNFHSHLKEEAWNVTGISLCPLWNVSLKKRLRWSCICWFFHLFLILRCLASQSIFVSSILLGPIACFLLICSSKFLARLLQYHLRLNFSNKLVALAIFSVSIFIITG